MSDADQKKSDTDMALPTPPCYVMRRFLEKFDQVLQRIKRHVSRYESPETVGHIPWSDTSAEILRFRIAFDAPTYLGTYLLGDVQELPKDWEICAALHAHWEDAGRPEGDEWVKMLNDQCYRWRFYNYLRGRSLAQIAWDRIRSYFRHNA